MQKLLLLVAALCLPKLAMAADSPVVVNGSFEADHFAFSGTLNLGVSAPLTGWTTLSNGIYPWGLPSPNVYIAGPTPYGNQWVIVGDYGRGGTWIQQEVSGFTPGQAYTLKFALASELAAPTGALVEVSFPNGSSTDSKIFEAPRRVANYWDTWGEFSYEFVATAAKVTIRFEGLPGNAYDAGIDNVSVEPRGCDLPVSKYRQDDPLWAKDLLDHSPTVTMKAQGCAVTALSMALSFAGVGVTPGDLNKSMAATKGDFNGLSVDWGPATRDAGAAALLKFHARRLSGDPGREYLNSQICTEKHPVIVGVDLNAEGTPGHFVLVTGKVGNEFMIADPGRARTKLSEYGDPFVTRGFVADPPGDISELDVAISDGGELLVVDAGGNRTGSEIPLGEVLEEIAGSAYFRDALVDETTGIRGEQVSRVALIPTPVGGTYKIQIIGEKLGLFTLSIRAFSQDGSPQLPIETQVLTSNASTALVTLQVDPAGAAPPAITRHATFSGLVNDIQSARELQLIGTEGVAQSLRQKVRAAEGASGVARRNVLAALLNEVAALNGKQIDPTIARLLREGVEALLMEK